MIKSPYVGSPCRTTEELQKRIEEYFDVVTDYYESFNKIPVFSLHELEYYTNYHIMRQAERFIDPDFSQEAKDIIRMCKSAVQRLAIQHEKELCGKKSDFWLSKRLPEYWGMNEESTASIPVSIINKLSQ